MEDKEIVDLYWKRDEEAITATQKKYGAYLHHIAFHIVAQPSDSEECVNDTYFHAWNSMPPQRPVILQTYLGKLVRRISIDCYRKHTSAKRGGRETKLSIDELEECIPAPSSVEQTAELHQLSETISTFLRTLPLDKRRVFLLRYWYSLSIKEMSALLGFSETKIRSMLSRTRKALKTYLEKEGYCHE